MRRGAAFAALIALLAFALSWNLTRFPAPWVDEGQHLTASATLARTGLYATPNDGRLELFDPSVQVGPAIIVPVSLAMRAAGVDILPARVAMAAMAAAAFAVFLFTASRLGGSTAALVTGLLLVIGVGEAFASFTFLSRQVLGEVLALGWLLGALLCLPRDRDDRRWWRVPASGACLAVALTTKGQLVFVGLPGLVMGWLIDRNWHRHWAWWHVPGAVVGGLLGWAAWQGWQFVSVGAETSERYAEVLWFGVATQIAAMDLAFIHRALGNLWRTGLLVLGPLAAAFALTQAVRRDAAGARHAQLLSLLVCTTGWFVVGSIGWSRYAFYPVALAQLWLGTAFAAGWAGRAALVRHATSVGLVALIVVQATAASWWWRQIASPRDTGFASMRAWVRQNVPPDARVETWEWSFIIDPTPRWTHPDLWHMYAITAFVMRDQRPAEPLYDPLRAGPDYLLQGPYGGWTGVYSHVLARPDVRKLVQFEDYALYALPDRVAHDGR